MWWILSFLYCQLGCKQRCSTLFFRSVEHLLRLLELVRPAAACPTFYMWLLAPGAGWPETPPQRVGGVAANTWGTICKRGGEVTLKAFGRCILFFFHVTNCKMRLHHLSVLHRC